MSKKQNVKPAKLEEIVAAIEEGIPWPAELDTQSTYSRLHDDHDGTMKGELTVGFSHDGDAWVTLNNHPSSLRFRGSFGGGRSLRTHAALMLLALAMKRDSEGDR